MQKRSVWVGPLLVTSLLSAAGQAAAPPQDELIFTNGDRLSGKLTRAIGDSIVFHSDMAGDITVPMSKVKELHTQGAFAVLKHGDPVAVSRKAVPGKIEIAGESLTVAPASAPAETMPETKAAYIIDEATFNRELTRRPRLIDGWNGTVTMGATVVQATQHGNTFTGGASLVRQVPTLTFFPPRNRTLVNFQETYGTLTQDAQPTQGIVASTVKTSIMHANAERDEYLTKKFFLLGTTTFDHNYAQLLQLQQIYGAGVGWTILSTPKQQFDLRVDAHYEKQEFIDPASNQNLFGSTFGETYRLSLPLNIQFNEALQLTPSWTNTSVYSMNFNAGLVLPVYHRLGVSLTTNDSYLTNPPVGAQRNSFQFVTGLTYSLR